MQEPGVIAAVTEEVFVFHTGVSISEHALLWLEDGVDASTRCDDVESCNEGVVGQGGDMLGGGHCLTEDFALRGGLISYPLKEMMMANVVATSTGIGDCAVLECLLLLGVCLDLSAWWSGKVGIVPVLHSNLHNVLTQLSSRSKAYLNLSVVMSPILSLEMRNVFFVWQRGCMSRMLSWSII